VTAPGATLLGLGAPARRPGGGRAPTRGEQVEQVEVRVLGPVRVLVDGLEAEVGGARPRALLAALALAGGRPLPTPDAVAAVWGDDAPPSAEATLRVYVSRLRRSVGAALRRDRVGLVLDAEVDADRFAAAVEGAIAVDDAGERADRLREALTAWMGEPLADVERTEALRSHAERLGEARLEAERALASALAASGRLEAAVDLRRRLAEEQPDREPLAGELMLDLYRGGRQREALDVYRATRAALLERAGIEPGAALQQLHERILAQDPALLADDPAPGARVRGPDGRPGARAGRGASDPDVGPAPRGSNLPLPLTSFIGRAPELDAVAALLEAGRLVTLTGTGGTGKTRLALEVARRRSADDGPWLVELAAVEDGGLVADVAAQTLGIGVPDGRPTLEVLVAALSGRAPLVVLDNCEHVLDDAASLAEVLLSRCPGVRILATSREPLAVPGERVLAVPPLPVVERTPELIAVDGDAMRLFLERARQVLPDLEPAPETLEVVRRICRELDGLPLAIELAAAELRALSPGELAAQLADRFAVLTSGPRTALPRQRTLQTTVAWSVDLLDPDQRELFAELSVFVGGFDLAAVRAVCGGGAAALLPALVAKSLVEVDTRREPRRYRMLETLRQYGASRCAELVLEAAEHLKTHAGPSWERRLDSETGNVRVGLRTAIDRGDWPTAVAMADGLWWYWFRRARLDEGRRWLAEIAAAADHPHDGGLAGLHLGQAYLAFFAGDASVEEHDATAIAVAEEAGDRAAQARVLLYRAYRHAILGWLDLASRWRETGLALLPDDAPDWLRAEVAFCHAQVSRAEGDRETAEAELERARAIASEVGHRWLWTVSTWVLGEHALDLDRPRAAGRLLGEALELARADGDRGAMLGCLRALAGVAARSGRPTDGARLLGAVQAVGASLGMDVDQMEQADAARTRAVVAAALRPSALEAALTDGARLRLGRAVALGLEVVAAAADE
jgi:predicted ATPase/DNA-binding SARP family transcriptional activator